MSEGVLWSFRYSDKKCKSYPIVKIVEDSAVILIDIEGKGEKEVNVTLGGLFFMRESEAVSNEYLAIKKSIKRAENLLKNKQDLLQNLRNHYPKRG